MNVKECRKNVESLLEEITQLKEEYNVIWHCRNKISDYKYSIKRLEILEWKYKNLLILLNDNI